MVRMGRLLYTVSLTSFEILEKETNFFLEESNMKIPHSVLKGATPFEIFTGNWSENDNNILRDQASKSRKRRLIVNQALQCISCTT